MFWNLKISRDVVHRCADQTILKSANFTEILYRVKTALKPFFSKRAFFPFSPHQAHKKGMKRKNEKKEFLHSLLKCILDIST